MITWMQRHKKYLVITIWISVIAFVGAGFVGWGNVDLNTKRSQNVAMVGDLGVSKKEFQEKFNVIFATQSAMSDGALTQEEAIKRGFDIQALMQLIQEKLFLNYAYELGLYASDDEVLKAIVANEDFHTNNKFDKEKYFLILKNNGIKNSEFEEKVRNGLIVGKLFDILKIPANDLELEMLVSSLFLEDELKIKVVKLDEKINPSEEEVKKYWEVNKDKYMSKESNTYSVYEIIPDISNINENDLKEFYDKNKYNYKDSDGKIKELNAVIDDVKIDFVLKNMELNAKKKSIALKKGEEKFQKTITERTDSELSNKNKDLKIGQVSKPFVMDKKYFIVRLESVNKPEALKYEDAKITAREDLEAELYTKKLEELAKNELKKNDFNGKNIGFVSKLSRNNTDLLNDIEFFIFLNGVFSKNDKKSYVLLSDKAIIYEILSQKLVEENKVKENINSIKNDLVAIKQDTMLGELLEELQKRYKVVNYYKGSEF